MFVITVLTSIQEIVSQHGLSYLYQPDSQTAFTYHVTQSTASRTVQTQIQLQMLFVQYYNVTLTDKQQVLLYEEDRYQTVIACDKLVEPRRHVCQQLNGSYTVTVLNSPGSVTVQKITNVQLVQTLNLFYKLTYSNSTIVQKNVTVLPNTQYSTDGVTVYFSSTAGAGYRKSHIVSKSDLSQSFYYQFFNITTGCNQFPTNQDIWEAKLAQSLYVANKCLFVPQPLGDCTDSTPGSWVLEKYENDTVFSQPVTDSDGFTIAKADAAYPTIQLQFAAETVQFAKASGQVQVQARLIKDLAGNLLYLRVQATSLTNQVADQVLIKCDGRQFVIPQRFYQSDAFITYFRVFQPPNLCTIGGLQLDVNLEELAWQHGQTYTTELCDAKYHMSLSGCFSGCANDTVYDWSVNSCVNVSCSKYGNVRPNFYAPEHRCVNYAESARLYVETELVEAPFVNQYANVTVQCVNGSINTDTSATAWPCICDIGYSQSEKIGNILRMCLVNVVAAEPVMPYVSVDDVAKQFSKDVGGIVGHVIDGIGGLFKSQLFMIVVWIAVGCGCVLVTVVVIKVVKAVGCGCCKKK